MQRPTPALTVFVIRDLDFDLLTPKLMGFRDSSRNTLYVKFVCDFSCIGSWGIVRKNTAVKNLPTVIGVGNWLLCAHIFAGLLRICFFFLVLCFWYCKKVKFSHTRYRVLSPELIPVYRQVTWSHPPGGRLPLLSARPVVTFPAEERHRPSAGTKLY